MVQLFLTMIQNDNHTDSTRRGVKRKTINHTEEASCWDVKDEEGFWKAWRQYLN
ncbi:hypothetical protein BD560DRAFT_97647 [Blakeslea trispora]|nr:hypothetical protein BD560DRAFT_97647 [Blakeslea trispora]